MKNILTALFIGSFLTPAATFAAPITPGYYIDTGCTMNYNVNDPNAVGHPCDTVTGALTRIYRLEVAVQDLQAENAQLEAKLQATAGTQGASGSADPGLSGRVSGLEARVSTLEKIVNFLQSTVIAALGQILVALKK